MHSVAGQKSLLRFITCGSVDDGKSTLIGRLLYDTNQVPDDQLEKLEADSKHVGTQRNGIDFSLLLDGLSAEREQGITIDVAYRYFSTASRKFIVADTPGHEQYTRNMVTGASTAEVAIILVDARHGVVTQTRRHTYLVSLLGIRRIVVAINKMDLVRYSKRQFDSIESEYRKFTDQLGSMEVTSIPVSALLGQNVTSTSSDMSWYSGPTLLQYLETVDVDLLGETEPFRMPVQWVNRPDINFRGFSGTVARGVVRVGDRVCVLPSGQESSVARIVTMDGDLRFAVTGQAITLTLADEIDASRGDVFSATDRPAEVSDQFEADLVWMSDQSMVPGRSYFLKSGTKTVGVTIRPPKYRTNVNNLEHTAASVLELNEIGVCALRLDRAIAFDPYAESRTMGSFIVLDRVTGATVGAGLFRFALRRSHNVHWQSLQIDRAARSNLNGHGAGVVWFTGLSGSGKSTIADIVEKKLHALGVHTYLLDGDNLRHGLNRDLGFTEADRIENIRRASEVAALLVDAGLLVIASFISPFQDERIGFANFLGSVSFVRCSLTPRLKSLRREIPKVCIEKRDRGNCRVSPELIHRMNLRPTPISGSPPSTPAQNSRPSWFLKNSARWA